MAEQNKPVLGYWNARGRAQWLKTLLEYAGVDYVDHQYKFTDPQEWHGKDKAEVGKGTNFPNLPYYKDGDFVVAETLAVGVYLIQRYDLKNLMGDDVYQRARMVEVQGIIAETITNLYRIILVEKADYDTKKATSFVAYLQPILVKLDKQVGDNKFLTGNSEKWTDFYGYEWLNRVALIWKEEWKQFANLEKFLRTFEQLPKVKEYLTGDKILKQYFQPGLTAISW